MTEQAPPPQVITIFLVDDHALFRTGVKAELARAGSTGPDTAGVTVIGEASSVAEAVAGIGHLSPQVVLLDVHLPDGAVPRCCGGCAPRSRTWFSSR